MRSLLLTSLALIGCAHATPASQSTVSVEAIVGAPDRSAADRALDPGRKPAAFLLFLDLRPGMRVAELFAGGGYSTELLARAVGPTGVVFGQNSKMILEKFAEAPWSARLKTPAMRNVVRVDRELDEPLPPEASNLDLVLSNVIYHDTVWQGIDRAKMNGAVFRALRSGGTYAVCDSSAKEGRGVQDVKTLHRIEEATVKTEIEEAGFRLASEDDFLRNPNDARDWNSNPVASGARRGTSDRFCLRFVKP